MKSYLGTDLSPDYYYKLHSGRYYNLHISGINKILDELYPYFNGRIIDFGCGDGLVTKHLNGLDLLGVDNCQEMINRYVKETKRPGYVANFWDALPKANTVICCYALHLCPNSRLPTVGYRLLEAGIDTLIIISPLKRPSKILGFKIEKEFIRSVGPDKKNIHVYIEQVES